MAKTAANILAVNIAENLDVHIFITSKFIAMFTAKTKWQHCC